MTSRTQSVTKGPIEWFSHLHDVIFARLGLLPSAGKQDHVNASIFERQPAMISKALWYGTVPKRIRHQGAAGRVWTLTLTQLETNNKDKLTEYRKYVWWVQRKQIKAS